MRNERPLLFFSLIGLLFVRRRRRSSRIPVFLEYLDTGLVRAVPDGDPVAARSASSRWCAIATGLILDLVAHVRREAKQLAYLSYAAPRRREDERARIGRSGARPGSTRTASRAPTMRWTKRMFGSSASRR